MTVSLPALAAAQALEDGKSNGWKTPKGEDPCRCLYCTSFSEGNEFQLPAASDCGM